MPLGKDLAAIRAQQNLSIEDIHDATRIPYSTIQEIESETIFYDDHRNTTYMRSFVRTYAKALKINDEDAVQALDQMADDAYNGIILKKYGDGNAPVIKTPAESKQSSSKSQKSTSVSDSQSTDQKSEDRKKESAATSAKDSSSSKQKTETPAEKTRYAGETKTTVPPSPKNQDTMPDVKSINWADTGRKMYTFRNNKKYIYGSVVALLIVIIAGYLMFRDSDETPMENAETATETLPEEGEILPETPIDTSATVSIPSAPEDLPPDAADIDSAQAQQMIDNTTGGQTQSQQTERSRSGALPDTLQLIVHAVNDKLEPVRVKSDLVDGYSPYWIEQGVAMRFDFTTDIHVRGQYTRMELFVNGNYMEDFREYRGDENQIHITRELLEENPQLWMPQEIPADNSEFSAPDTVINRPVFF